MTGNTFVGLIALVLLQDFADGGLPGVDANDVAGIVAAKPLGYPAAPPPSRRYRLVKPPSRALSSDTPKRVCLRDSDVPETPQ